MLLLHTWSEITKRNYLGGMKMMAINVAAIFGGFFGVYMVIKHQKKKAQ